MNTPISTIRIMLVSDSQADAKEIKQHLDEKMRLPWSLMHCINLKEAAPKAAKANLIILDLGLTGNLSTPKDLFEAVDHMAFETPIIVLTGEGKTEHNLATIVMEKGAADIIVRGKFDRLIDAIEFALIRQKIATHTRKSADTTYQNSQRKGASNLRHSQDAHADDNEKSRQMLSMLMGGYSASDPDEKA